MKKLLALTLISLNSFASASELQNIKLSDARKVYESVMNMTGESCDDSKCTVDFGRGACSFIGTLDDTNSDNFAAKCSWTYGGPGFNQAITKDSSNLFKLLLKTDWQPDCNDWACSYDWTQFTCIKSGDLFSRQYSCEITALKFVYVKTM